MVNDLFHSYPDHLLVDIAAVHSVQVHPAFGLVFFIYLFYENNTNFSLSN